MPCALALGNEFCFILIIMDSNDLSLPRRNIDVALARAFVATAETGSMTAAAHLLNVTQGAISQQIKRLEDLLQKQLFDREGRQLALTAVGERLLLHARRLIALNDEIWGLMSAPDFEGVVRLGVPRDIVRPLMPPILRSFNEAWPKVRTELVCRSSPELREALSDGKIDLAVTTETDTPAGAERLLTDDLVWIGGPGGRAKSLDPTPIAVTELSCTFRGAMVNALEKANRDWRLVGPVGNNDALLATLEADLAVASLLRHTVPDHVEILGPADGMPPLIPFHVNLYCRTSETNPVARELADHVRERLRRRYPGTPDTEFRRAG